ncbi:MAG: sulfatase family protein, partial [Chloroflexota bacterium]
MSDRPNILFLMPDQLRADALGCAGHPVFRTPNIDRLAREGVHFTHAYANSPLCMPARASVISGVYPHNHQIQENAGHLPAEDETFAQLLQRAGYATAYVGKVHAFPDDPGRNLIEQEAYVRARGFDYVHEIPGPGALAKTESYLSRRWRERGLLEVYQQDFARRREDRGAAAWASPLPVEEFPDSYVGAQALEWLRRYEDDRPFFLWVGFGGPHPPFDAPGDYATMYDPATLPDPLPAEEPGPWVPASARERMLAGRQRASTPEMARQRMASYGGKLTLIDDWVGRILDELDTRGLAEHTLVVFWSDHGEMGGDHQRYQKSVFYEPAARVPLLARWPAGGVGASGESKTQPARGCCQALVEQIDLFPTVLEAAGAPPSPRTFGRSLLPLARGETAQTREAVFSELAREVMVRTDGHKYAVNREGRGYLLYDLRADPHEQRNLTGHPDYREVERELRERMLVWLVS